MADEPPGPLEFHRSQSDGGIPIYCGDDIKVTDRSRLKLKSQTHPPVPVWYGATSFEMAGETWSIEAFLNCGGTGQTYRARQTSSGKTFAAKFIHGDFFESKEVDLVMKLPKQIVQHPNVIKYEMIVQDVRTKFPPAGHILFMELLPNGELFDFIASTQPAVVGKPVSEGTSRRFLHDVISGMAEFYRCCMTHRDLKPDNLMLNEVGRIVIIDLDTVKAKTEVTQEAAAEENGQGAGADLPPPPLDLEWTTTVNYYGTSAFAAPEVLAVLQVREEYSCQPADIWSVGVIAFCLHAKMAPFKEGRGIGSHNDIGGPDNETFWNKMDASPGYKNKFPQELKAFINCLWQIDPAARPSFRHLEDACAGGEGALEEFPGLRWLAAPVNETSDFIAELRRTRPSIQLDEDKMLGDAPAHRR